MIDSMKIVEIDEVKIFDEVTHVTFYLSKQFWDVVDGGNIKIVLEQNVRNMTVDEIRIAAQPRLKELLQRAIDELSE